MLLITDRHYPPRGELGKLIARGACRVNTLDAISSTRSDYDLIFCDVDLTNFASARLLRQTLAVHRAPTDPLVFLLRDDSYHTVSQARALGASEILRLAGNMDAAIQHLLKIYPLATAPKSCVPAQAKLIVKELLDAGMWGVAGNYCSVIDTGAQVILDATEAVGIQHWMNEVWSHDDLTYQHCLLVAGVAAAFGSTLGLSREDKVLLTTAGLVHDVGKAFIPREVLNKEGKLTPGETANVRRHPTIGYAILKEHGVHNADILSCVRSHHELLDGSGYPKGLSGSDIPDIVRMITICDVFSALVERRPYKDKVTPDRAIAHLLGNTHLYDRTLVSAFRSSIEKE